MEAREDEIEKKERFKSGNRTKSNPIQVKNRLDRPEEENFEGEEKKLLGRVLPREKGLDRGRRDLNGLHELEAMASNGVLPGARGAGKLIHNGARQLQHPHNHLHRTKPKMKTSSSYETVIPQQKRRSAAARKGFPNLLDVIESLERTVMALKERKEGGKTMRTAD